jgi:hypothetical protein
MSIVTPGVIPTAARGLRHQSAILPCDSVTVIRFNIDPSEICVICG